MMNSKKKKVKIVYILSFPKSGSTLLGNVLGAHEAGFHGGEIERLWLGKNPDQGLNRMCGCQKKLKECDVWGSIFENFSASLVKMGVPDIENWVRSMHRFPNSFESISSRYEKVDPKNKQAIGQLYEHIREATGSDFIVDSSKTLPYLELLLSIPAFEVYVVHLIRDVRAVLNSRYRKIRVKNKHGLSIARKWITVVKNILDWNYFHYKSASLFKGYDKYHQVKYESLTENFEAEINALCAKTGIDAPFISKDYVQLSTNHTVFGNQNRFKTGKIEIRKDERWRTELSRPHRIVADLLSMPVMHHFEYDR